MIRWSVEIKTSFYIDFNKNNVVRTNWWRHLLRFVYSVYRSMRESFTPWAGRSVDAARAQREELACIPEVKVGICRRLVQRKGHTLGLLLVWQRLLEMQAKSFRPVPCSINAANVQILLNATLTLIVVRHSFVTFVYFKLYFYNIKITLATGR